ncbi:pyridoxal phosphate-dependent transferase [Xylariales sp. PMI_506]|nr:pyridoxal phosphate-dependent transferase [Xylariales sp. PMI_506]
MGISNDGAAVTTLPMRANGIQKASKPNPQFGSRLLQHFAFDPSYRNFNQGSFGASPREIVKRLRHYQDKFEARPDPFTRYELPNLLDEARAAVAEVLNAPTDTVVFVPNASVAVNTVLRNLAWHDDGRDEILYFSSVYAGCGKTIDYIVDSHDGRVSAREIALVYPCEDDTVVAAFVEAVDACEAAGKRARICLFDCVSSLPAVRFPFERVTAACRDRGVLSLIDGAQGIGQIPLDLTALDPDFFLTNLHKWFHTPRGCSAFYVPLRNQAIIVSTLPTSHGYVPRGGGRFNPLPPSNKPAFVANFQFTGTLDTSSYLCALDAVRWRRDVLGGEEAIMAYTQELALKGGRRVAEILGTEILENESGTLTRCSMVMVALPIQVGPADAERRGDCAVLLAPEDAGATVQWMHGVLMGEHNTYIVLYCYQGRMWTRLSAQVYLEMQDFEWAGQTLREVCQRVARGENKGLN